MARYRCLRCGHEWNGAPGPGTADDPTQCPKCGHLYVSWLNYKEWEK